MVCVWWGVQGAGGKGWGWQVKGGGGRRAGEGGGRQVGAGGGRAGKGKNSSSPPSALPFPSCLLLPFPQVVEVYPLLPTTKDSIFPSFTVVCMLVWWYREVGRVAHVKGHRELREDINGILMGR